MDWTTLLDIGVAAIDPSFITELLSTENKTELLKYLTIIGIVWKVMGKKVAEHFTKLEQTMTLGFANLTSAVNEVRETLKEVETTHNHQIQQLSTRVAVLEKKPNP